MIIEKKIFKYSLYRQNNTVFPTHLNFKFAIDKIETITRMRICRFSIYVKEKNNNKNKELFS